MSVFKLTNKVSASFSFIKNAVKGEEMDYTKGSIQKAVFMLAIPMILEMMMESVFAVVDIFFVGKIGNEAVATVALTESVLTFVYSVAIGLSMAATALVARRVGEKNFEEASKSGMQVILIALVITAIISIVGLLNAENILHWMGATDKLAHEGAIYTRVIFSGSIVIMLLFVVKYNSVFMLSVSVFFFLFSDPLIAFMNSNVSAQNYAEQALHIVSLGYIFYGIGMVMMNAFNGAGDTKTPTLINLVGFWVFQIPLAYLLSFQFNYGPKGVFIAIVSSETLIALIALIIFRRGKWKLVKV